MNTLLESEFKFVKAVFGKYRDVPLLQAYQKHMLQI